MLHDYRPGDFVMFQIESGYALLRVLDVVDTDGDAVWHLAAYRDFFLDPDDAEAAIVNPANLAVDKPHVALTDHAFQSTQTARMGNAPLMEHELVGYESWKADSQRTVSDRSIRLLLGLR